jgi:signal transduction histidine kinase
MPAKTSARILIVDDEAALMKSLCETLRAKGYETVGRLSGEAGLATLRTTQFDLLLTDLMMPGMNGIALLQAAQQSDAQLVSVVMTGAGSTASAVEAMKAGALDYISKPFELSVILAVLARSLAVRRLRVENVELAHRVAKRTTELEAANQALRTSEEQLRTLADWAVQAQEDERAGLALTLHDNITQLLCAIQIRTQTLLDKLPPNGPATKREATKLRDLVGIAAEEVETISRQLRPGVLEMLGLAAVLRDTGAAFAERTGVGIQLDGVLFTERLPAAIELALYRIYQIALNNVELHAHARNVSLRLEAVGDFIQLSIKDDGIGFESGAPISGRLSSGLGLLRMRERATSVGGSLKIESACNAGTEIEVRIPNATIWKSEES